MNTAKSRGVNAHTPSLKGVNMISPYHCGGWGFDSLAERVIAAPSAGVWKPNHTLLVDHEIVMRASIIAKREKMEEYYKIKT